VDKGGRMKVKLKEGEKISSMNNFCGLDYEDWVALNQGKEVDLVEIPKSISKQVNNSSSKKGDK
jgi:predicted DNA-binding antitoxin AbrB/MazE fold protein